MSDLYIETDKGRVFIIGDDAKEIIVPPGYVNHVYGDAKLPDLPPIEYDMSEEEAQKIREMIEKSIRNTLKIGMEAENDDKTGV